MTTDGGGHINVSVPIPEEEPDQSAEAIADAAAEVAASAGEVARAAATVAAGAQTQQPERNTDEWRAAHGQLEGRIADLEGRINGGFEQIGQRLEALTPPPIMETPAAPESEQTIVRPDVTEAEILEPPPESTLPWYKKLLA